MEHEPYWRADDRVERNVIESVKGVCSQHCSFNAAVFRPGEGWMSRNESQVKRSKSSHYSSTSVLQYSKVLCSDISNSKCFVFVLHAK